MRNVSIGVSPINLKKNKCSRHFSPILLKAGKRSSNLANRPGSSGYLVLQYSSREAYTFSRNCSTSWVAARPFASEMSNKWLKINYNHNYGGHYQ
jgi:hypothetical protein